MLGDCVDATCVRNQMVLLLTLEIRGDTEHQEKPYIKRSLRFAKINRGTRCGRVQRFSWMAVRSAAPVRPRPSVARQTARKRPRKTCRRYTQRA